MLYLKSIPANCYKHPLSLCLYILFIAEALRWFKDFSDDRVIVICIFMFILFLSNRIGEKLRRIEDGGNEGQDRDECYTQPEKAPRPLEPTGNETVATWWG